jgi:CheY-like chemotaxis protein
VVLAEDDVDVRRIVAEALEAEGHEVRATGDPYPACVALR